MEFETKSKETTYLRETSAHSRWIDTQRFIWLLHSSIFTRQKEVPGLTWPFYTKPSRSFLTHSLTWRETGVALGPSISLPLTLFLSDCLSVGGRKDLLRKRNDTAM